MVHLVKETCTVYTITVESNKEKKTDVHTTAKEYLRTYGPNIYAVVSGHSCYICFYVIRIPIQISFGISFQELWRFVCNNGTFLKNTKSSADTKINKSDVCNQRGLWQTKHSFELQSLFSVAKTTIPGFPKLLAV